MLRNLLPILTSPRARMIYVPLVELVGTICLVVAAFRYSTTLGFAALGLALLLAAIPIEVWAKRPR